MPGLRDHLEYQKTIRHVYDHEYLAFAKSTKTLISIKHLLDIGYNEDASVLARSIFESYLAARFVNENVHTQADESLLDEYISNRIKISLGIYSVEFKKVVDENRKNVSKLRSIGSQLVGMDKLYYKDFYTFLSGFAHLDFSKADYFIEGASFTIDKENDEILARLTIVFVMTKLFETIVTIKGEDFYDDKEEEKCYELVKKSLLAQRLIFNEYISEFDNVTTEGITSLYNNKIKDMLINMNYSLEDNIGDFIKRDLFKRTSVN